MNTKNILFLIVIAMLSFGVWGCEEYGKVDQGRVVAFENDRVTVIEDKNMDAKNPDYSILPPHTYTMPTDPMERGANPMVGLRLKIDVDKKYIKIFDPQIQDIVDLPIEIADVQKDIGADHPLVADKKFPVIDKETRNITIFSPRQKLLCTFIVPEEYIDFPDYTWEAGDEVRIYWKEKGVALRFMNITKTNIFKK